MQTTKVQFTPGPWKATRSSRDSWDIASPDHHGICTVHDPYRVQLGLAAQVEADTRLMAAAPLLLEALKAMVKGRVSEGLKSAVHRSGRFCHVCGCNSPDTVHSHGCPLALAEAAIAAAEGRE
jgi:hypothetical protein